MTRWLIFTWAELYRLHVLSLAAQRESSTDETLQVVNLGLGRFPTEVSLLGLETDVALTYGRIPEARLYLEQLPSTLFKLPQWENRLELTQCLEDADAGTGAKCALQAKTNLDAQLQQFLNISHNLK